MPTSSDSDVRPLAYRVLRLQFGIGLAVVLVCLVWGRDASLSALAGVFTGVIANLYMTFRALEPARSPQAALGRMYFGQLIKVVLTVGLFVLAYLSLPHVVWPALLVAYLATLAVSWSAPLRIIRRGERKD